VHHIKSDYSLLMVTTTTIRSLRMETCFTGWLAASTNGKSPSTPSSNSWLPSDCERREKNNKIRIDYWIESRLIILKMPSTTICELCVCVL
jgi:hypothetical protein